MNAIEEFATSLLSLNLHAVITLIWKKILSHTLFKFITISRSSTLLRVFLMGRSGCRTKEGNLAGLLASQKVWTFPFCWISTPLKNWFPLSPDHTQYIGKKVSLTAFRQILSKLAFSVTQSRLIWKSSLELNALIQNSVQQDYLPELYPIVPLNGYGKHWGWGWITRNSQKFTHFPHQKKNH